MRLRKAVLAATDALKPACQNELAEIVGGGALLQTCARRNGRDRRLSAELNDALHGRQNLIERLRLRAAAVAPILCAERHRLPSSSSLRSSQRVTSIWTSLTFTYSPSRTWLSGMQMSCAAPSSRNHSAFSPMRCTRPSSVS